MNNHSRLESITVKKNLMYGREDDNKPSKILLKWNWGYGYQGALRTFSGPMTQKIKWMEERTDRIFAFQHPQKIKRQKSQCQHRNSNISDIQMYKE